MTPGEAIEIATFLDQAAMEASEVFDIGQRLRKPQPDDPAVPDVLHWPFAYELLITGDPRTSDQGPYDVLMARGDRTYPPYLHEIADEILDLWDAILNHSTHPFVVSRLADLLWIRRHGQRPYDYAVQACRSLVDTTHSIPEPIRRIELLQRAASIALSISSGELQAVAADALIRQLKEAISEDSPAPGVVFGGIDGLEQLPAHLQPQDLIDESLIRLLTTTSDPWIVTATLDRLSTKTDDPEKRDQLQRQVVQAWLDRGDRADDITRLSFYEKAYEAAQAYGINDLRNSAAERMQQRPVDLSELTKVRSEVPLPEEFAEWMDEFSALPDWPTALLRLTDFGPLASEPESTKKTISEESGSSLSAILPTKVLGPEGSLITEVPGGEDGVAAKVRQRQAFYATYLGHLMTEGLARSAESLPEPDPDALFEFFNSGLAVESAEVFVRAVIHHVAGRYDEAIHISFPRIEHAIRNAARGVGLIVLRLPEGEKPGGVRPLGSIIASLRGAMPEPWRATLDTILTDPLGLNLRNAYAHGLAGTGSALASTLLIYVAVLLARVLDHG